MKKGYEFFVNVQYDFSTQLVKILTKNSDSELISSGQITEQARL